MAKIISSLIFVLFCMYLALCKAEGVLLKKLTYTSDTGIDKLLESFDLEQINKKLQGDRLPAVSPWMVELVLSQYGTTIEELLTKLDESDSTEDSINIINNVFDQELLIVENDIMKINFGGALQIYQTVINGHLKELYKTNFFLGFIISNLVRTYQRSYIPYMKAMCDAIEVPLKQQNRMMRSASYTLKGRGIFDGLMNSIRGVIDDIRNLVRNTIGTMFDQMQQSLENLIFPEDTDDMLKNMLASILNPIIRSASRYVSIVRDAVLKAIFGEEQALETRTVGCSIFSFILNPIGKFLIKMTNGILLPIGEFLTFLKEPIELAAVVAQGTLERIFCLPQSLPE